MSEMHIMLTKAIKESLVSDLRLRFFSYNEFDAIFGFLIKALKYQCKNRKPEK